MKGISRKDWQILSAYIDGEMSTRERARFESRLEDSPELKAGLEDLIRTKELLRSQPKLRSPRNFTLTPEMAGQKQSVPGYPGLRLAAVVVSILFIFIVMGDYFFSGSAGMRSQLARESESDVTTRPLLLGEGETAPPSPLEAPAEVPLEEEKLGVRREELEQAILPEAEAVEGEGEPFTADEPSSSLRATVLASPPSGTIQPGAEINAREFPATPTIVPQASDLELEPLVQAQPPANDSQSTPISYGIPSVLFQTPLIRILEIAIAILAVGMWVAVGILRRR